MALNSDFWKAYLEEVNEERHSILQTFNFDSEESSQTQTNGMEIKRGLQELFLDDIFLKLHQLQQSADLTFHDVALFAWHSVLGVFLYSTQTVVGVVLQEGGGKFGIFPHLHQHLRPTESTTLLEAILSTKNRMQELSNNVSSDFNTKGSSESIVDNAIVCEERMSEIPSENPIVIIVSEESQKISIDYNANAFNLKNIRQLVETLKIIMEQIANNSNMLLSDLVFVSADEQAAILRNHRNNSMTLDQYKSLVELFEENVAKSPGKTAVVFEEKKLTYAELDALSNQLAHFMINKLGVQQGDFVALIVERSEFVAIGILGIWKAGAVLVSIDSKTPIDRMNLMLSDANVGLILTDNENIGKFKSWNAYSLDTDTFMNESNEKPEVIILPETIAQVTFSSGSTGTPKGVLVPHISWGNDDPDAPIRYRLTADEAVLTLLNPSFAGFQGSVTTAFSYGYALVIPSQKYIQDTEELYRYANQNAVTHLEGTPSLLSSLDLSRMSTLIRVKVTGEVMKEPAYASIRSSSSSLVIYNGYGSSEARLALAAELPQFSEILRPVANKKSFVLSRSLKIVPTGAVGELCFAGAGVAVGYLNLDKLSRKTFVENPFQEEYERMFRSGDLGRRYPDGSIEYIGRRDLQVKIRGFRVELGDIETTLGMCPGVKQCAVLAKPIHDSGEYILIAYIIGTAEGSEILDFLRKKLPEHMIPAHVIKLDKFPMKSSGKLNVPQLLLTPMNSGNPNFVPPKTTNEITLCTIWEDVLSLPKGSVGIEDSFFRIGGNSIFALRVVNQLNKELGCTISASHIFNYSTVASFIQNLPEQDASYKGIPVADRSHPEALQLSFQQERLWVWDHFAGGLTSFNLVICFEILPGFSFEKFKRTIQDIVNRHEVLRTVFKTKKVGIAYQSVLEEKALEFNILNTASDKFNADFLNFKGQCFDLYNDIPIKVTAFEVNAELKYIAILIPHIAFDFWSRDLFLDELCKIYQDDNATLPVLDVQYIDYAQHQRKVMTGEFLQEHLAYWKNAMKGYQTLHLPYDRPRIPGKNYFRGEYILTEIEEEISVNLRKLSVDLGVSLYSVLLAGFFLMLSVYSKQDDIYIASPLASRNHSQVESLLGFFMNALPLRQKIDPNTSVATFIKSVFNTVSEANKYLALSLEMLMEAIEFTRDPYKNHHLSDIFFQVNESPYDKQGHDLNIPLRLFSEVNLLETPANDLDLTAVFNASDSGIRGILIYPPELFNRDTAMSFYATLKSFLYQFAGMVGKSDSVQLEDLSGFTGDFMCSTNGHITAPEESSVLIRNKAIVHPRTPEEITACQIFASVLGIDATEFGITQDFFDYGGNGLLALRVLTQMKNQLGILIDINEFYDLRTVENVLK